MNDFYELEIKFSIETKNYERAYKVLRDLVKDDLKTGRYKTKNEMIVSYFELLTSYNCYNELKEIYMKTHNRCVYYRNGGKCYGMKNAPHVNCKGNRRKCEQ